MPRIARIVLPGYLYHITQRGNYRQKVFSDEQDRATYLKYIEESRSKTNAQIYAYCLMDNHVHFIVKPHDRNSLARLFSRAHMKYAHYFNRRKDRQGHLWQGRFFSSLISGINYISAAFRYVENNPVRAKMVRYPWDYVWSSARAHLGKTYRIIHLADVEEYINLESWKHFLLDEEHDEYVRKIRESTKKGFVFAPDEFIKKLEKKLSCHLLPGKVGRPKKN